MQEAPWMKEARRLIGTVEVKGPDHNPAVLQMWKSIKRGGIKDDETPWCAAFVGHCLEEAGVVSSRFESAKSYLSWGVGLEHPEIGCIAVFERQGGGHVGFVVGRDKAGHLLILGGNQADAVNVKAFDYARVTGYRWPLGHRLPPVAPLPILVAESLSTNEA